MIRMDVSGHELGLILTALQIAREVWNRDAITCKNVAAVPGQESVSEAFLRYCKEAAQLEDRLEGNVPEPARVPFDSSACIDRD